MLTTVYFNEIGFIQKVINVKLIEYRSLNI